MTYERFCIYGFGMDYPKDWKIELGRKHEWRNGQVSFTSPLKNFIRLIWGPLKDTKEKYPEPKEYADEILKKMRKATKGRFTHLIRDTIGIGGHRAIVDRIRYTQVMGGFIIKRSIEREQLGIILYCDRSERLFVAYGIADPERFQEDLKMTEHAIRSLKCHNQG